MSYKVKVVDVREKLPEVIDLFVASTSFESRCLTLAGEISEKVKSALLVSNIEYKKSAESNTQKFKKLFGEMVEDVELSLSSPTSSADKLRSLVIGKMQKLNSGTVFIDVTTFTHEQLLILLALIKLSSFSCDILMGYTGAGEYSTNTDTESIWLSRGITKVRSVLGYPGRLLPTRKLHLVILVGFESERARGLIELMEPDKISLGVGRREQSYSESHFERNQAFFRNVGEFLQRQSLTQIDVAQFEFSCVDPIDTKNDVLKVVSQNSSYNTVICPMNTKFSTLGAGLAALVEDHIQIIYAQAAEYNVKGYSTPGDTATIFPLSANE